MPSTPVPSVQIGSETVPVDKLETGLLQKFSKAIERGYNLPAALKNMDKQELTHLKGAVDGELRSRGAFGT